MASSIAAITMPRSMDFSRATASAICNSSILLALTAAMVSLSFAALGVAPRALRGQAMSFGVGRGGLLLQFRLRRIAPGRIAFLGMRRRERRQPEVLLQLAFGDLAAPHRFGDQLISQHQSRVRDVLKRQRHLGLITGADVIAVQLQPVPLDALEDAAESLAAVVRYRHLDF